MSLKRALGMALTHAGISPQTAIASLRGLPAFLRDRRAYIDQLPRGGLPISEYRPFLNDRAAHGLTLHYFHQDLWAARKVFAANPERHVDIGSRVDGFLAHLLVFRDVEMVDARPLDQPIAGLRVTVGDATHLPMYADNSLESLSSLHAAEHFGLGRYGDVVQADGHVLFMRSLARVLMPGGRLYFSVPCGRERLQFNAQRILSPRTVLATFEGLQLASFAAVTDDNRLDESARPSDLEGAEFACGLFELTKH